MVSYFSVMSGRKRCFHADLSRPYLHLEMQNVHCIDIHSACEVCHFSVQVGVVAHIGHNDM